MAPSSSSTLRRTGLAGSECSAKLVELAVLSRHEGEKELANLKELVEREADVPAPGPNRTARWPPPTRLRTYPIGRA